MTFLPFRLCATLAVGVAAIALTNVCWAQSVRPQRPAPTPAPAPTPSRSHAPGGPAGVLLVASGDLRGEIKPCGCSPEGQMGGLPRRLTYLEILAKQAREPMLKVDLGNNFPEPSPQGRLKVEFIQAMLKRSELDAVLPGPNEIALGLPALDRAVPYVVSNSVDGKPLAPLRTVNLAGKRRIVILGYLAPDQVYQGPQTEFRLQGMSAALLAQWKATLRRESATTALLLFRGGDAELAQVAEAGIFHAILSGNPSADELKQITERTVGTNAGGSPGNTTVPQVPTKGQGVLRLRVGGFPAASRAEVDWLKDNFADHPAAAKAMAAYDEQVKELFFQQVTAAQAHRGSSPFAGANACKDCHAPAVAIWQGTRHAKAIETLQRVGKQFDPECLSCHVVGLSKQGYISQDVTPELANVQCENCHGAGKAHAANPAVKFVPTGGTLPGKPGEPTCRTCHVGSHSPTFDFATYWLKIFHGGPGMTVAPAAKP